MYIRQLSQTEYDSFKRSLEASVPRAPMDASYQCDVQVNHILYRLRLQFCDHCRLLPLQAVRFQPDSQEFVLMTDPLMLGALTELIYDQYSIKK